MLAKSGVVNVPLLGRFFGYTLEIASRRRYGRGNQSFRSISPASRGCGRRERRAKCTFAYSRVVPGPLTSHRDAANGVDVLYPTGRPRRRL